ncbi:MAG: ATP-binding protein [Thiotrichaceae bacterium]
MSKQQLQNEHENLKDIGFDLLGYINFEKGKFTIEPETRDDLNEFFQDHNFSDAIENTTAYIQDVNTKIIHWHSIDPDVNLGNTDFSTIDLESTLYTYPITVEPNQNDILRLLPENIDAEIATNKHIVYAYGFQHSPHGKYQLVIAKSADKLANNDKEMQSHLIILFSASAMLVLLAQLATSYWVIAPIKDFEEEIKRLESGDQETIVNPYPDELVPIKGTINALVQYEVGQKRRYRDALDDLAHSLKTPLAAIQGYIDKDTNNSEKHPSIEGISTQLENMKGIVSYQLRRAVVTNHHAMISPTAIRPVLVRLKESLVKVYHDKTFDIVIKVENDIRVRMDDDDLLELFGNLLNNACRFCENLVEVNVQPDGSHVIINIDDDGMGFPDNNPSKLLKRGIRADSQTEGQGIGLAVCTEIVEAAGGSIELLISPQVGARVRLRLPA